MIQWLTAFIDRPADVFDPAVRFWTAVTGSTLSAPRGDRGQFATLEPPDGDAYLCAQRIETDRGCHLDLHVDDVGAFTDHARACGAAGVERLEPDLAILTSPAGAECCVVDPYGAGVRPSPRSSGGVRNLVDQLCVDVPADRYDEECRFWARLTGWDCRPSTHFREFSALLRPPWSPLRLLLQRRDDSDGPARAHLDLASSDVAGLVAHHQRLGAVVEAQFEVWTALRDPSGFPYCITSRDPITGVLAG